MKLEPEDLRREIDDTLAELDRLENEVVELFGEILGPDAAQRVKAMMLAKERDPSAERLRQAGSPEPSTERREIR